MRIRDLTLRNYRVYAEAPPFKIADRFTVVAGINGRGKTALRDGLALWFFGLLSHVSSAAGDVDMRRRLRKAFSGTHAASFDTNENSVPRDGGQL